jgi:hypothetical protein
VFNTKLEGGAKRWTDLKNRVVEHVSVTDTKTLKTIHNSMKNVNICNAVGF